MALQTQTAFEPSRREISVPGTAPAANEKVKAAKVRNTLQEPRSLSVKTLYSFCPTLRMLPVQMVVLCAVPMQVLNRHS